MVRNALQKQTLAPCSQASKVSQVTKAGLHPVFNNPVEPVIQLDQDYGRDHFPDASLLNIVDPVKHVEVESAIGEMLQKAFEAGFTEGRKADFRHKVLDHKDRNFPNMIVSYSSQTSLLRVLKWGCCLGA